MTYLGWKLPTFAYIGLKCLKVGHRKLIKAGNLQEPWSYFYCYQFCWKMDLAYWKMILSAWHPIRWRLTNTSLKPLHDVFLQFNMLWPTKVALQQFLKIWPIKIISLTFFNVSYSIIGRIIVVYPYADICRKFQTILEIRHLLRWWGFVQVVQYICRVIRTFSCK